ncbi:MAG: hypothetical protein ABI767_13790, partial [Rhodanobacter sp.]
EHHDGVIGQRSADDGRHDEREPLGKVVGKPRTLLSPEIGQWAAAKGMNRTAIALFWRLFRRRSRWSKISETTLRLVLCKDFLT